MHVDDLLHGVGFRKFDVMKKAASEKCVRQFFFIVRGDDHQRAGFCPHLLLRLIDKKFHPIQFQQQIVRKLDVGFINFINQQDHLFVSFKGLPHFTANDVVANVMNFIIAKLTIPQSRDSIVFIKALLGLGR